MVGDAVLQIDLHFNVPTPSKSNDDPSASQPCFNARGATARPHHVSQHLSENLSHAHYHNHVQILVLASPARVGLHCVTPPTAASPPINLPHAVPAHHRHSQSQQYPDGRPRRPVSCSARAMQPSAQPPAANHDSARVAAASTSTAAYAPDTTSAPTPAAPSTTNATLLREAERRPDDVKVTEGAPADEGEEEEQGHDAPSLAEVCRQTHERIERFLARDSTHDALLGQVQAQTRTGLGVVAEALRRYR